MFMYKKQLYTLINICVERHLSLKQQNPIASVNKRLRFKVATLKRTQHQSQSNATATASAMVRLLHRINQNISQNAVSVDLIHLLIMYN